MSGHIKNLARISELELNEEYVQRKNEFTWCSRDAHSMPLEGVVNADEQIRKNQAKIDRLKAEIAKKETMLDNKNFTTLAPKEIVETEKKKLSDMREQAIKLEAIRNGLR
jgi:valyl-tRNA synthetase